MRSLNSFSASSSLPRSEKRTDDFFSDHVAQGADFQTRIRWKPRSVVLWDSTSLPLPPPFSLLPTHLTPGYQTVLLRTLRS